MNTKDKYAEFVEGFLIAADTDGTGDEMIKDIEESPDPWGAPWLWVGKGWLWVGKGWQPQAGESWRKAGARWYKQNAEEIREELAKESEEV